MREILFVDDDSFILNGLRSLLRKQRETWEMSFVTSGSAALETLALRPRDIVVSDMRMPGMDGAELLYRVRELYPRTARIILSGQAGHDDLIRARPVAQQILCKPCERSVLCEAIDRLFKVQALLADERIHTLVGKLERLPLFPKSYLELSQAMAHPLPTMAEIVRVVERQPALSVMVLSIANAGYFGRAQAAVSIETAVKLLGVELLRALALSTDLFSQINEPLLESRTFMSLPQRSLLKAQLARSFVRDAALTEEAFEAALLMDIGYIVLGQSDPAGYLTLLNEAEKGQQPIQELERERFGFTHAEVSGYLLGVWGLPAPVVEVVVGHHLPELLGLAHNPVAAAIHTADVLVDALWSARSDPTAGIDACILNRPEVRARLPEWQIKAQAAASGLGWTGNL
jgi:HD-like signal output (HDOD) protein